MSAVPYRVLGESAQRKIADLLQDAISGWLAQLFGEERDHIAVHVDLVDRPVHLAASTRYIAAKHDDPLMQIGLPSNTLPRILSVPLEFREQRGIEATSTLVDGLQHDLLSMLVGKLMERAEICDWELIRNDQLACTRPVHFQAQLGDLSEAMVLTLSASIADSLSPAPSYVCDGDETGRAAGISETAVELEVRLGESHIALGEFTTLAVDDVLVLDRELQDTCGLFVGDDNQIGTASLGKSDGLRAVRVAEIVGVRSTN